MDINDPTVSDALLAEQHDVEDDMEGEYDYWEDIEDPYDPWNDPDWEPPCDCWCELCGCHGYCMDLEDDEYDTSEELDD